MSIKQRQSDYDSEEVQQELQSLVQKELNEDFIEDLSRQALHVYFLIDYSLLFIFWIQMKLNNI
ncbi:hypothetical protein ACJ72_08837 [Emergomyces africanus]|uniref:Uncharacterized protein n=1 Tax=Emergomyces africanus TaxID=1955775 RepID=A0A1B7NJM7_9EURO|nr:hypothetical protein ACJ72_08837 [Emergomyces africanus]